VRLVNYSLDMYAYFILFPWRFEVLQVANCTQASRCLARAPGLPRRPLPTSWRRRQLAFSICHIPESNSVRTRRFRLPVSCKCFEAQACEGASPPGRLQEPGRLLRAAPALTGRPAALKAPKDTGEQHRTLLGGQWNPPSSPSKF
jgi:hypothetical protein